MPNPLSFLTRIQPDRLDYMRQSIQPGPAGIAGLLGRPGVSEGLLAAGLNLLASDQKRETFGQSLLRSVSAGVSTGREAAAREKYEDALEGLPPEMATFLRMLRPEQGAALLAQAAMQGPPDPVAVATNERLVGPSGEIIVDALPETAEPPELPSGVREFLFYDQLDDAGKASFREFLAAQQAPGVTVNTGDTQGNMRDEYWGARYGRIQEAAEDAMGKMDMLAEMSRLASTPEVYQGTGGEALLRLKELGSALGLDMSGVAESQALKAIAHEVALELRDPAGGAGMPGALSNNDLKFLQSMVPRLTNTPEGNALIIAARARFAQRQMDIAQFADEYAAANGGQLDGGFTAALRQRYGTQDIFADLQARAGQANGEPANPLGLPRRPR